MAMTGPKIRRYLWLLCGLCWAYDLYLWGGLAETPKIGPNLVSQAGVQYPVAATYLFLGGRLVRATGLSSAAQHSVSDRFPYLMLNPDETEYLAVDRVKAAQGLVATLCYNLAPLLLVLSLIAHWLRQKQIRVFGPRR